MTTTIKVEAHCNPTNTQVEVLLEDGDTSSLEILQDGDIKQYYIYGNKYITVTEVPKHG